VIITVPRIGFKISEEVIITSDNDYSSSFTLPTLTPEPPRRSLLWQHRKVAILFILLAIGLMLFSQIFTDKKQSSTIFSLRINVRFMAPEHYAQRKYSEIKSCSPQGSIVLRQRKYTFSTDN
jgi:hypothetical protein